MTKAPAAVTTRGTNLSNRARLIKARIRRGTAIANAAHVALAAKRYAALEPVIRAIHGKGKTLLREIAAELNGGGRVWGGGGKKRRIPAARGGKWSTVQGARVLSRIGAL